VASDHLGVAGVNGETAGKWRWSSVEETLSISIRCFVEKGKRRGCVDEELASRR
jgi:hypothetical protein